MAIPDNFPNKNIHIMKNILIILLLILVSCNRNKSDYINEIIVFDNTIDYPETKLKLSDIAEIQYIPLKGINEGYLVGNLNNKGNNIQVVGNNIYLATEEKLYVYDKNGNPIRQLAKIGKGPEEYNSIGSFGIDMQKNNVYIQDLKTGELITYDTLFQFKSKIPFYNAHSMVPLNHEYAMIHDKYQYDSNNPVFLLGNLSTGKVTPCQIKMERPYIHDFDGTLDNAALIHGKGGLFLCNMRSDTIRWIDKKSMDITPRMVDITPYENGNEKSDIMIVPAAETDDYIFFSLIFSPIIHKEQQERAFLFDKEKNKFSEFRNLKTVCLL